MLVVSVALFAEQGTCFSEHVCHEAGGLATALPPHRLLAPIRIIAALHRSSVYDVQPFIMPNRLGRPSCKLPCTTRRSPARLPRTLRSPKQRRILRFVR